MALIPYRRGSELTPARMFEDFFRMPDLWEEVTSSVRGIAADVYETPDAVIVELATPGVNPDDLNINVTGDILTISGESRQEEKSENRNYYQKQIRYGTFAQSVTLPATVQSANAEATFNNGILRVSLPKSEEAKPRKIAIKVNQAK